MPSTVYLVTGGARSGKSSYAEKLCLSLSANPIYLATARRWDGDFDERIARHQRDRGDAWTTIEEPLSPSLHSDKFSGKAVLVDCLTLWLTNYMTEEGAFSIRGGGGCGGDSCCNKDMSEDKNNNNDHVGGDQQASQDNDDAAIAAAERASTERALTKIKEEFDRLTDRWDATFVFVTNELGSGTHASTNISRKFVDCQGWFNQHVAARADRVIHMVCGCAVTIKEPAADPRNPLVPPSQQQQQEAKMLDRYLSKRRLRMDDKGYFIVKVDHGRAVIVASFHSCMLNDAGEVCDLEGNKIPCHGAKNRPEPLKTWESRTAKELTTEIFERWSPAASSDLGLSLGHAAYIGREAQRAERSLCSGEHFHQD